jgi:hypothetical protein
MALVASLDVPSPRFAGTSPSSGEEAHATCILPNLDPPVTTVVANLEVPTPRFAGTSRSSGEGRALIYAALPINQGGDFSPTVESKRGEG